jgi:hypothetical protein
VVVAAGVGNVVVVVETEFDFGSDFDFDPSGRVRRI